MTTYATGPHCMCSTSRHEARKQDHHHDRMYRFTHVHEHLVFAHQNQQSKHVGWHTMARAWHVPRSHIQMACPTDVIQGISVVGKAVSSEWTPSRETTVGRSGPSIESGDSRTARSTRHGRMVIPIQRVHARSGHRSGGGCHAPRGIGGNTVLDERQRGSNRGTARNGQWS